MSVFVLSFILLFHVRAVLFFSYTGNGFLRRKRAAEPRQKAAGAGCCVLHYGGVRLSACTDGCSDWLGWRLGAMHIDRPVWGTLVHFSIVVRSLAAGTHSSGVISVLRIILVLVST